MSAPELPSSSERPSPKTVFMCVGCKEISTEITYWGPEACTGLCPDCGDYWIGTIIFDRFQLAEFNLETV